MIRTFLVALILVFAAASVSFAQDDTTPTPEPVTPAEVEVNGMVYPLASDQPVIVFVDAEHVTNDGVFLALRVFARDEQGRYYAMTPCGVEIGIPCETVTTRAVGVLTRAHQGSSLVLSPPK